MNKNQIFLKNFSLSRYGGFSNSLFWWFSELGFTSGGVNFFMDSWDLGRI
jgi:hypothetical protein